MKDAIKVLSVSAILMLEGIASGTQILPTPASINDQVTCDAKREDLYKLVTLRVREIMRGQVVPRLVDAYRRANILIDERQIIFDESDLSYEVPGGAEGWSEVRVDAGSDSQTFKLFSEVKIDNPYGLIKVRSQRNSEYDPIGRLLKTELHCWLKGWFDRDMEVKGWIINSETREAVGNFDQPVAFKVELVLP